MNKIVVTLAVTFLAVAAITAVSSRAYSQGGFPDEPGRDTLLLVCTQCHSAGKIVLAELTSEDWEFIVYDMASRGAPLHQEDIADLTQYLQNNFATDRKKGK